MFGLRAPDNTARIAELEAWTGPSPAPRYNLTMGAIATATTSFSGWGPSSVVNGDRKSLNAYSNGAWSSSAAYNFPEWVQVDLGTNKTISEIHVFTLQDAWNNSVEPTTGMTFTLYGLTGYDLQYWTGSSWVTVPGGTVTGNNKIWKTFTFSPISTSKLRVLTNAAPDGVSRVTEIEAYAPQTSSCQSIARLDPLNATGGVGENPLSQNFNWNLPLVVCKSARERLLKSFLGVGAVLTRPGFTELVPEVRRHTKSGLMNSMCYPLAMTLSLIA